MAYVYILESLKSGRYYIGSTTNLEKRIKKHTSGAVHTTRRFLPLRLVFYKEYSDIKEAMRIEYRLKRLKRKDYLKKIVDSGKIFLRDI